jgi:hypothetical protein
MRCGLILIRAKKDEESNFVESGRGGVGLGVCLSDVERDATIQ